MRGGWFGWVTMAWAFALASVLTPTAATGQAGLVGQSLPTCVARVAVGDDARAMLRGGARFDCVSPQTRHGPGDYWVLSSPTRIDDAAAVRSGSLWQRRMTLHILYGDGHIARTAVDGRAATRSLQLGALFELPIPARGAPAIRLLWQVEGAANLRGIVTGPRIARPEESRRANLSLALLYGAFGGLCVALIAYNLALWAVLRHRFQLHYCALLAMLGLYALSSSGGLAWLIPDMPNNVRLRVNYLTLAGSAITALLFARAFFEPRVFQGWPGRASWVVTGMLATSAVGFALAADRWPGALDRCYALSFMALTALSVPVLWRAWRRRSDYLRLFALAWAAPIILASLRVAGMLGLMRWSFLLDNSTLVSMTLEAVLSSLAIAYRIRILSRERDEAREQEFAARLLADTDPLTGLANRRAFLREAIGREGAQRLILVDLDRFKQVNETIGHDGGDQVLRNAAAVLMRAAPAGTLVARIGGEEFALLVSAGEQGVEQAVLEHLRAAPMPFDLAITASIGVAAGPLARESDWASLYRRADQALFAAKQAGRDRVRHESLAAAA